MALLLTCLKSLLSKDSSWNETFLTVAEKKGFLKHPVQEWLRIFWVFDWQGNLRRLWHAGCVLWHARLRSCVTGLSTYLQKKNIKTMHFLLRPLTAKANQWLYSFTLTLTEADFLGRLSLRKYKRHKFAELAESTDSCDSYCSFPGGEKPALASPLWLCLG